MRSFLLLVSLTAFLADAGDWPKWRGPSADGISAERIAPDAWDKEGPKPLWKAKVGVGFTAATVADGKVFTLGNVDKSDTTTLWCLDAVTGAVVWKREWPSKLSPVMYEGGPNSSAVADGGRLFVVIKPALVLCLDAAKGATVWENDLAALKADLTPWGIIGSPIVLGDRVVVNYGTAGTALDKSTGKLLWTTGAKSPGFNTPALATPKGEPTLMVLATNHLAAIRVSDGKEQWQVPFGQGYFCHSSDPVVKGDEVFISSADDGGAVVRFTDGKPEQVWKNRQLGTFLATALLIDGHLYGLNSCDAKGAGAQFRCVDWKTGEVKWSEGNFGSSPGSPVATAGNRVLLLSDKGELTVAKVTPEKFELIRRDQVIGGKCWTPPTLANGKLYVRNAAGDLVCVEVAAPKQS